MRKLIILMLFAGFLAMSGTAIADTYVIAKNDKVKKQKQKHIKKEKQKKGPNAKAYEHANPNAKFKRYDDYTPKEKEKLDKKKWDEMTDEEQESITDRYKKKKDKLDEIMRGKKTLEEIQIK